MCDVCREQQKDDVRWLAVLIRQGLKVIVVGIERRYGLREETQSEFKDRHKKAA